ncbi:uncharacterized protein HD556DRAFT_1308756 [Suillus plorans]|uniref:Uncharacterized protein n=1 Tax=Suillus plorans TaxID=116603 RepID=A0A9P7DHV7_9AGAM|nr:uncharacterized protein HD556DRAFT_1308756 [Suillus plorans]KAG1793330.1 hypothetical protein HD556DRAFT_1308756 [Suillus plorans]
MQYPDETIDISQLTMKEFVGHSRHLFTQMQDDQTEVDFICFVLAARVGPLAGEELDQYQNQGAEVEVPTHKMPNMPLGKVQRSTTARLQNGRSVAELCLLQQWARPAGTDGNCVAECIAYMPVRSTDIAMLDFRHRASSGCFKFTIWRGRQMISYKAKFVKNSQAQLIITQFYNGQIERTIDRGFANEESKYRASHIVAMESLAFKSAVEELDRENSPHRMTIMEPTREDERAYHQTAVCEAN